MPPKKKKEKKTPQAKYITLDYYSKNLKFDILEGTQRTAQEGSAGRAFLYLNKMHQYRKRQAAQ